MNERCNCSNCKFFKDKGETGECRRRSPQVIHLPEVERITGARSIRTTSFWPPIGRSEWCGEHEPDFCIEAPEL